MQYLGQVDNLQIEMQGNSRRGIAAVEDVPFGSGSTPAYSRPWVIWADGWIPAERQPGRFNSCMIHEASGTVMVDRLKG